ncbi:MAG TPA: pyruvate kinase [Luteibaculaceae bacterium]|nr:pyruvate kinase [Luteibaculaceae bacterium]
METKTNIVVEHKTKIVATLGPASDNREVLREMMLSGLDVCRLNFSHGLHEVYAQTIQLIRDLSAELNHPIAILADLQGPKLRVGEVENNGVELINGNLITFTTEKMVGTAERVYMTYTNFPKDVKVGEKILMDDGKLQCEVVSTNRENEVVAKITHGGILGSKKGVNLPNTNVSLPCLTEKDLADLEFVLQQEVDWIGLSFVRRADDIRELRAILKERKSLARIVAKIEKPEALREIDEIIEETDAIMVARGDLGVEIPMQQVPLMQKMLIKKARKSAKPVIVATQMMESMITNITPTRAEVNDVANAVMDGADAVMLSGETSVGKFPVEVIRTMGEIITEVEKKVSDIYHKETRPVDVYDERFITNSICHQAVKLAARVDAKAIVTMTHSGYTAFKLSSFRPKSAVYAFSSNRRLLSSLSLVWGVRCFYYDKYVGTDQTISDIKHILQKSQLLEKGDYLINIASMPITERGMANMMKLSEI